MKLPYAFALLLLCSAPSIGLAAPSADCVKRALDSEPAQELSAEDLAIRKKAIEGMQEFVEKSGYAGNNSRAYAAAIARGDAHLKFLKEIGVDKASHDSQGFSMERLGQVYEAKIQEHLQQGRLKPEDVIYPAHAYRNEKGEFVFVKAWEPRPPGRLTSLNDEISDELQLLMQKEGYFVLGQGGFFHHDLGHVSGYLDHPEYMAATRALAKKHALDRESLQKWNRLRYHTQDQRSFYNRYFFASEEVATVPLKYRGDLEQTLVLPKGFQVGKDLPQYDNIKRELEAKQADDPGLNRYLESLVRLYDRTAEAVGGGARDIFNPGRYQSQTSWSLTGAYSTSDNPLNNAAYLAELARAVDYQLPKNSPERLKLATRLTQWLILSHQYEPKDWVNAASKTGPELQKDPLVRSVVDSGVLDPIQLPDWNGAPAAQQLKTRLMYKFTPSPLLPKDEWGLE